MRKPTRTRIVETIAAAVVVAATVVPLAAASPTRAKHVQIPARLNHIQEPGSTGYLPPSISYQEPGSTGYLPPSISYQEPGSTGYLPPTMSSPSPLAGEIGLARGILETEFGFSSSHAADWTTGVCSYGDKPSSCYLTPQQAAAQSRAQAQAMGVPPLRTPAASGAPSRSGDAGLAQGVLDTQFGFSPSRAQAWTTGVCSYGDNPSTCYLTPAQAKAQSYAEAQSMGARPTPSTQTVTATASPGFHWGDAGIGAGVSLGLALILAGLTGARVVRSRRRSPSHA